MWRHAPKDLGESSCSDWGGAPCSVHIGRVLSVKKRHNFFSQHMKSLRVCRVEVEKKIKMLRTHQLTSLVATKHNHVGLRETTIQCVRMMQLYSYCTKEENRAYRFFHAMKCPNVCVRNLQTGVIHRKRNRCLFLKKLWLWERRAQRHFQPCSMAFLFSAKQS